MLDISLNRIALMLSLDIFCCLSPSIEKPTWYFAGWRRLATTVGPSCVAPTSRAAPTPWHMSTAEAKRDDLPATPGMALYTKVAPTAWKSSSPYSVTHTATPNSDEFGDEQYVFFLFFLSHKMTSLMDVLCHSTLQQVSLKWLVRFENQVSLKRK